MHGSVMMFLFAVPILEAISIMLLPQMMGARDLPFPRLSAYGYWRFLIGGIFVSGSLFFGVGSARRLVHVRSQCRQRGTALFETLVKTLLKIIKPGTGDEPSQ